MKGQARGGKSAIDEDLRTNDKACPSDAGPPKQSKQAEEKEMFDVAEGKRGKREESDSHGNT